MMEGQVPVSHSEYVRLIRESNRVPGLEQRIADLEAENQAWEFQIALVNKNRSELREEAQWMEQRIEELEQLVTLGTEINGDTSDGYHTFNELYHHRAVLFSVIVRDHRELAWKARKHHDGTMYDGMFIVGIDTPKGQATYHYDLDPYWGMFDCEEREFAPEWDGHTPDDAIARIAALKAGGSS